MEVLFGAALEVPFQFWGTSIHAVCLVARTDVVHCYLQKCSLFEDWEQGIYDSSTRQFGSDFTLISSINKNGPKFSRTVYRFFIWIIW